MASKNLEENAKDPQLRARPTPDYVMGCKRLLFFNTYYPALCQPNVEVITGRHRSHRVEFHRRG